jgi:hypothetical protein
MSVIAPAGVYVWGRQESFETPATLLRQTEPPPSSFNRNRLKAASGTRLSAAGLYEPQTGARRKLPTSNSSWGATAAYVPPISFPTSDFNRSRQKHFPRVQRSELISSNPWAGTAPRTTDSAIAYVDLGQSDDAGSRGPVSVPTARDRLSLSEIATSAKELAEAVENVDDKDILDEVRAIAVALSTTAMKRPLSEDEEKQWRTIADKLQELAAKASTGDIAAPVRRQRFATVAGPASGTRSSAATT